jgi:hypothetical protein
MASQPQVLRIVDRAARDQQSPEEISKQILRRLRPKVYSAISWTSPVMMEYPNDTLEAKLDCYVRQAKERDYSFRFVLTLENDQKFESVQELRDRRMETCNVQEILGSLTFQEEWQAATSQVCARITEVILPSMMDNLGEFRRAHIPGSTKMVLTFRNGKYIGLHRGCDEGAGKAFA